MGEGPLKRYRSLVDAGSLEPDPAQLLAAEKLELLANRLAQYEAPPKTDFFSFFTRRSGEVPQGLYLFGAVGARQDHADGFVFRNHPFRAQAQGSFP